MSFHRQLSNLLTYIHTVCNSRTFLKGVLYLPKEPLTVNLKQYRQGP